MNKREQALQLQADNFSASHELMEAMVTHRQAITNWDRQAVETTWKRLISTLVNFIKEDTQFLEFMNENTEFKK